MSNIPILLGRVERGAGLAAIVVVVRDDAGLGVHLAQVGEQVEQSRLLVERAGVLRNLIAVRAADIAHAYRVGVVATAMGSGNVHVAAYMHRAVAVDDVVIPYVRPALVAMPAADVVDGVVLALGGRGAVDDDLVDMATGFLQRRHGELRQEFG